MTNKLKLAANKAEKRYVKETPETDRAMASAAGEYARGPHRFLPAVGWVRGDCLVLIGFLLRMQENVSVGSLAWSLPYTPTTAYALGDLMATLGWNGRVWPPEPGKEEGSWPTDEEEVRGLKYLMAGRNIERTFTFPTRDEGNTVLVVNVQHEAKRDFPLDPRPFIDKEADMEMRDELHRFVAESHLFLGDPVPGPHLVEPALGPGQAERAGHDEAHLEHQESDDNLRGLPDQVEHRGQGDGEQVAEERDVEGVAGLDVLDRGRHEVWVDLLVLAHDARQEVHPSRIFW